MSLSSRYEHAWTFRISSMRGIFGIVLRECCPAGEWTIGKWDLCYFPSPDDPLADDLAVTTALITRQEEYPAVIREFAHYSELVEAFRVGELAIAVTRDQQSWALGFSAPTRARIVAMEDCTVSNGSKEYTVRAGSVEQNFPSYLAASRFFETLAATVSFIVEGGPRLVLRAIYPGQQVLRHRTALSKEACAAIRDIVLCLAYGSADAQPVAASFARPGVAPISWVSYRAGGPLPPYMVRQLWWEGRAQSGVQRLDKYALSIEDRPRLFVVAGFLGSGKTSFLQSFLEYHLGRGRFVAVIQNELGKVSLDGKLTGDAIAVTELTEGAVCCTLLGDLRPALREVVTNYQPDLIILEMSGAANPLGFSEDMLALEEWITFDSVTTIVDAENFRLSLREHEIVGDQVRAADLIVINKTDLISPDKLVELKQELQKLNDHATITETRYGYVNPRLLYDADLDITTDAGMARPDEHRAPATPTTADEHHHNLSAARVDYRAALNMDDLIAKLSNVPPNIVRIKGVVQIESGGNVLVQFVGGRYEITPFDSSPPPKPFLVFIGNDAEAVAEGFWCLERARGT